MNAMKAAAKRIAAEKSGVPYEIEEDTKAPEI
jgi:hypothetical protein